MPLFERADHIPALWERLDQLDLPESAKNKLISEVKNYDRYDIPFSWSQIFDNAGYLEEYESIKDPSEIGKTDFDAQERGNEFLRYLQLNYPSLNTSKSEAVKLAYSDIIFFGMQGYKLDFRTVASTRLGSGRPVEQPTFLPNDHGAELEKRLKKLKSKVSKEKKLEIRLDLNAIDRYGIPLNWTEFFEHHGLGEEYAEIRSSKESLTDPVDGVNRQADAFSNMIERYSFVDSVDESFRADMEALGSRGYRVGLEGFVDEHLARDKQMRSIGAQ